MEEKIVFPETKKVTVLLTEEEKSAVIEILKQKIEKIDNYEILFDHISPAFLKQRRLFERVIKKLE